MSNVRRSRKMHKSDLGAVVFLNPRTCGIYKNGSPRFRTDTTTGKRTTQVDNELLDHVTLFLEGKEAPGSAAVKWDRIQSTRVLVPTYFDPRHNEPIRRLLADHGLPSTTIGELLEEGLLSVRGGHGSPSNDQRTGTIPYIKVSDIRALRINVNPTNLVSEAIAHRHWRGGTSGLQPWDVLTPNRASSNIGEFAILLPGEENVVLTKEIYVFRIAKNGLWDPFYLLWALSLRAVREQWRRIALMQTNREDCGERYREVMLPAPKSPSWAKKVSGPFKRYFETLAQARAAFVEATSAGDFEFVPTIHQTIPAEGEADAGGLSAPVDEEP